MLISDKFYAVNIREYLALGDDPEAGEPALDRLLSGFSCPKNPFDTRQTASDMEESHELVQLLRLL